MTRNKPKEKFWGIQTQDLLKGGLNWMQAELSNLECTVVTHFGVLAIADGETLEA